MDNTELRHYGVLGMKWGVRRATYKRKSAESLVKSANNIKKDLKKLEIKKIRQDRRAAKHNLRASKKLSRGSVMSAGRSFKRGFKHQRRAQKREKTIWHNKKLLDLYDKRINELDPGLVKVGKEYAEIKSREYGTRKTFLY